MITTLVQFKLPSPITLAEATRRFEQCAEVPESPRADPQVLHPLGRRPGRRAASISGNRAPAAERVYNGEWRERVEQLYGATPTITWFDSPVVVDNLAGGAITKAA